MNNNFNIKELEEARVLLKNAIEVYNLSLAGLHGVIKTAGESSPAGRVARAALDDIDSFLLEED